MPPQGPAIGLDDPDGEPPGTAAEAIALLERAHDRGDAHLALVTEEQLAEAVGPVAGPYAEATRAGCVLHMLDEFVHHGADPSVEDPNFHATPLVWAEFREQPAAAEVLRHAGIE